MTGFTVNLTPVVCVIQVNYMVHYSILTRPTVAIVEIRKIKTKLQKMSCFIYSSD